MAKKIKYDDSYFDQIADEVIESTLEDEVERKYALYTYYTIQDRALPDVCDGLKPVQRRILYTMHKLGLTPSKNHTKSARIVGDCMGNYHPHGDASIYDALVRLAQPFTFPAPPIDGQGNFGKPGVGAAASRYTEARLSVFGQLMTEELGEKVVKMIPNYDDSTVQPLVLPAQIPNLLINGQTGIAVAMATNMAPHNPREAMNAIIYQLRHQDEWEAVTTAETDADKSRAVKKLVKNLMKKLPGPDFPTGGGILGIDGAQEAYETGYGKIIIQAKYRVEQLPRGRHQIVFYELPYGSSPNSVMKTLTENEEKYMKSKRIIKENGGKGKEEGFQIEGVVSVDDFADIENPVQLVVVVDAKTNPEVVVADLFKRTSLQVSFNYNQNCLVNGTPKVVNLPEMIQHFINFRRNIVKVRSENEKQKREDRKHILDGLAKVLLDIDKTISIIRGAESQDVAQSQLMSHFSIDEVQSKHVLDTPLRRLTKYDSLEVENELKNITARINELDMIIEDPEHRDEIVDMELNAILENFKKDPATARRSEIVGKTLAEYVETQKETLAMSRTVSDDPCHVYLDEQGRIQRTPDKGYLVQIETTTLGQYYVITNKGRGLRVNTVDIVPGSTPNNLMPDEKVVALASGKHDVVLGTKQGIVYAFQPNFPTRSNEFTVISLADGDEVISGFDLVEPSELVFTSSDSSLLRYSDDKVSVKQSVSGKGMAGMKLGDGAEVISFSAIPQSRLSEAMVVTYTGSSIKATALMEYPQKGRATGGVRSHTFLKGEDHLDLAMVGVNPMVHDEDGRRLSAGRLLRGRSASGVKLKIKIAGGFFAEAAPAELSEGQPKNGEESSADK